ncbi:MAG TPA: FAD-dependent oxidoreductase [Thermoleophilaceae bacterium]|nr:FAD-dependent oxidoreductase [Thermoleophilaceae bacterium]
MDRPMRVYGLNVVEQFLDDLLVAVGALLVALGIAAAVFEDGFDAGGLGGGMLVAASAAAGILLAAGGSGIRQNRVASELGYALLAVAATGWIVNGAVVPSAVALATGVVLALVLVAAVALRRRALRLRFKPRFFSLRQFSTLIEVADAMIDGDGREALDPIEVAVRTDHLIARVETPVKKDLKLVLVLVEWLLPLMILRPFPFSVLGSNERRRAVDKVINAKGPFRDVARSLKVLACAGYYGSAEALAEVGFVRFEDRDRFKGVDTTPLAHPDPFPRNGHGPPERAHAVVIGSGAAGSVMAYELTRAGLDVTVLEAGRHQDPQTFQHSEVEMFVRSYKAGGLQTTSDHHMLIVQGATVGGSTVINNAIWLEADLDRVLPEWAARGAHVPADALRHAYEELSHALHVEALPEELANRGASVFDKGRRALGMEGGFLKHNRDHCLACGWCNYGCRYDRKTSMLVTYLPWALARGAKLYDRCRDVRIQSERGVARSVRFVRNGREQVVEADRVVVCAGAIGSSEVLLHSGIDQGGRVGKGLHALAGGFVTAETEQEIDGFDGIGLCCIADDAEDYVIESYFAPPLVFSLRLGGWFLSHFNRMLRYGHFVDGGVMVATDPKRGGVSLDRKGRTKIEMSLGDEELELLKRGIGTITRVYLAGGAIRVFPSSYGLLEFASEDDLRHLSRIKRADDLSLGSAHPQGGNPMGEDPSVAVVGNDFRVHGFENLYVADASVFPSNIRANCQATVMAISHYAANAHVST